MSKIILSINMSLDGFADHTVAVHADDEMHDFFTNLLDDTSVVVFGRITFELMQDYWPHAHDDPSGTPSTLAFADKYNAISKVVFSRTLQSAEWNNSRIERGDLIDQVVRMREEQGGIISLAGISVAQQFMQRNLVDEYWLVVHPVLVGHGKRLFEGIKDRLELRPVDTRTLRSGISVLHYLRKEE